MATRAADLLGVVHARPGVTRAEATRVVGMGTGAAAEVVARLVHDRLLGETPAPPSGSRGRPTTLLAAHPQGPLVLAAEITHAAWRVRAVELGGGVLAAEQGEHGSTTWESVRAEVAAAAQALRRSYDGRVRALGVAVPGPVSAALRADAVSLGWRDVDLRRLWPEAPVLVAGNDATLAAAAESRRGAAADASVVLHLRVEAGLGGAVVDHGVPLSGATGAAGEFGHMPFGDPAVACPCGAAGCWGTAVDGTALARLLGRTAPRDHVAYARRLIRGAVPGSPERDAVEAVAAALGRGTAGLVNGIDADVVTLAGLGVDLLDAAPRELGAAYRAGLMAYRRQSPPPLVPAALGEDGPVVGAADQAWASLVSTLA
ncbi:ROK family protein [Microlunatus flavus]|uniref:Sugar kinase of the NBD/HSP70 family, may contain an N-terminal HTH domain n=1 Tax=Microlunatus flavus TaxID=1036181 RepID=A0A1H9MIB2_9ACTN|nr:ROK family protein [Microlunatus flavus]SER23444.1 Sugar kinase of the NBD/HSP70 family, may contain an N-terminal HTH domain [Microlunatus flavus]